MIDINEYLERLDEEEGREEQEREAYQRELFEAYVLRAGRTMSRSAGN